jgi:DUF4097 and DUF4098 domain-containing protein YvlB
MKTIKIEKKIELDNLSSVTIHNEIMGTRLVQGKPGEVVITAEINMRGSENDDEIAVEDIITVKTNDSAGTVEIEIDDFDFDTSDLSGRSEITVTIPTGLKVSAETDNYFIYASGMDNEFVIVNENGPVRMDECSGTIQINNENGPVKLVKLNAEIKIEQENGPISAESLNGDKLDISSENGPVRLRECQFNDVSIRNENGMIFYESLPVDSGSITIQNENGHISLAVSPLQGFSLSATAELGQIRNSFMGQETTMFDSYNLEVGDLALKITLTTENGMIKFSSSDMLGDDFFRGKLDYIKDMLKDNSEQGLKEVHKIIGQLIASLSKMLDKVNEDAVKAKIEQALATLKSWKAKINTPELQDSMR